jgi:hypothetical protein
MAATERKIQSYLDGEAALELPKPDALPCSPAPVRGQAPLIACSLCLRAAHGTDWVDAETLIRELRSFEHEAPPSFEPALCPMCAASIQLRRSSARAALRRAGASSGIR